MISKDPEKSQDILIQGLNVQYPWSKEIVSGVKSIETRGYPLSKRFSEIPIALVETPGPDQTFKARIVAVVWFASSKQYTSKASFDVDASLHRVGADSEFYWNGKKKKYGWIISRVLKLKEPLDAPTRRGRVWTGFLTIPSKCLSASNEFLTLQADSFSAYMR